MFRDIYCDVQPAVVCFPRAGLSWKQNPKSTMTVAQHTAKSNLQKLMRRSCYGNQKIIFLCSMPCYVINFDPQILSKLAWESEPSPGADNGAEISKIVSSYMSHSLYEFFFFLISFITKSLRSTTNRTIRTFQWTDKRRGLSIIPVVVTWSIEIHKMEGAKNMAL